MTAKEKAKELVKKLYQPIFNIDLGINVQKDLERYEAAKQCALIAVELHLEELSKMKLIFSDREIHYKFWQEVKKEIQNL